MSFSTIDKSLLAANSDRRNEIDMSEFWGEGQVLYAREIRPVDHIKVGRDPKCKGWPAEWSLEGAIYLATLVCQNEDGSQYFDNPIKNRIALLNMPQRVTTPLIAGVVGEHVAEGDAELGFEGKGFDDGASNSIASTGNNHHTF